MRGGITRMPGYGKGSKWIDKYIEAYKDLEDDWELTYAEKMKKLQMVTDEILIGIATDPTESKDTILKAIAQINGRSRDLNGLQHEHKIQGNPNKGFTVSVNFKKAPSEEVEVDED